MASAPASEGGEPVETFQPYRSVLKFASAPTRDKPTAESTCTTWKTSTQQRLPPWRRPVGTAYFLLNSEFARLYGEEIDPEEADAYATLLERTFHNFIERGVGHESVVISRGGQSEAVWTLDDQPMRGWVDGDHEVVYEEAVEARPSHPRWVTGLSKNL